VAFKKAQKVSTGTKILLFGNAGTRKSRTALTFPSIAYIDADQGADSYYEEFADNLVQISDSTTFAEVEEDLNEIENMLDEIETIVLDSDTKIYENQQHAALKVAEQRARKKGRLKEGEGIPFLERQIIQMNHDKMYHKLFEFKKHGKIIIVIAESKDKVETITNADGSTSFRTVGTIPNTVKGADFDFDIVLEMLKDPKTDKFIGAKVHKDRLGVTEEGEIIENPSYQIWKDAIEKKKNGGVKVAKRDFDKDIDKETEKFDVGKNESDELIKQITAKVTPMSKEEKTEAAKKFKEILGTADYTKCDDEALLKKCLEALK
jgi:hypothetical protein